jgi:hypothetical protein
MPGGRPLASIRRRTPVGCPKTRTDPSTAPLLEIKLAVETGRSGAAIGTHPASSIPRLKIVARNIAFSLACLMHEIAFLFPARQGS